MPDLNNPPSSSASTMEKVNPSPNPNGTAQITAQSAAPAAPVTTRPAETPPVIPAQPPRSLRMRLRFWRMVLFAGWLFWRVVFWQFVMPRFIGRKRVEQGNIPRWVKYAREARNFAVAMGGVMIKLGQFASTRADILPPEIVHELESLQDEVPGIPYAEVRAVIERELGSVSAHFQTIDEKPVAAASLGQVHRARLHSGERVVIKVQRPGIRQLCATDLSALNVVMRGLNRFRFVRRRLDAVQLADEFGRVLREELSYEQEARNAVRFHRMFADNMGVYIPEVYAEHSTDQVITLEDVTSIKVNDYAALEAAGISRQAVAARLMDSYLMTVFEERFFHADPHPGNLFVYPLPVDDEKADFGKKGRPFYLIFVDFGMTGSLTEVISRGLVSTLAAVINRDSKRMVECYAEMDILLPEADSKRLEEATTAAFDKVWGMEMSQISQMDYGDMADLAHEFNDLMYDMPFRMPQDFIYLGRTVGILSGMCTSLDPSYNPWHEFQPYVRRLLAGGLGLNSETDENPLGSLVGELFSPQQLLKTGQTLFGRVVTSPQRADVVLERLATGELKVRAELDASHVQQLARIEAQQRQVARAIVFGSFLLVATLLYMNGNFFPALLGCGMAGFTFLALFFGSG